jgi:hypothetical protein
LKNGSKPKKAMMNRKPGLTFCLIKVFLIIFLE